MPLSKGSNKNKDKYKIAVRQFTQQILSPPHSETTVWSYGSIDFPGTVAEGATEAWEIYNFTEDAHPIHLVKFKVLGRGVDGTQAPEP